MKTERADEQKNDRQEIKVSVVVPVYNAETTLERCLESLVGQTYSNLEIICINDGSTDKSGEILHQWQKQDQRIAIINQKNEGLSMARNAGLKIASGQYIMFCDSDDYYELSMCEKMLAAIENDDADLAICNVNVHQFADVDQWRETREYNRHKYNGTYNINDTIIKNTNAAVWNKIFRHDVIKKYDLNFPEKLLYEDFYFTKCYLCVSKKVTFLPDDLYHYAVIDQGIMAQTHVHSARAIEHLHIIQKFAQFLQAHRLYEKYERLYWLEWLDMYYAAQRWTIVNHQDELKQLVVKQLEPVINRQADIDNALRRKLLSILNEQSSCQQNKIILKKILKRTIKQSKSLLPQRKEPLYTFSIIIACYNVGKYLRETLESLVKQHFDLRQVQVIMVNDGSTDSTEDIAREYTRRFPRNFFYYEQENHGVSAARNLGMKYATGKYWNFLDGDDTLSPNTLNNVAEFLSTLNQEIPFVCIQTRNWNGDYHFNKRIIKKNEVIDLQKEPDFVICSVNKCFIRNEIIKQYTFDTRLKVSEDAKMINQILLEHGQKYGVVANSYYWYRKRDDHSSAIDTRYSDEKMYLPAVNYVYRFLLNKGREYTKGSVPKFIQFFVAYDCYWYYTEPRLEKQINATKKQIFIKELDTLITQLDVDVIAYQGDLILGQTPFHVRHHWLQVRLGRDYVTRARVINGQWFWNDILLPPPDVLIDNITLLDNSLLVKGRNYDLVDNLWLVTTGTDRFYCQAEGEHSIKVSIGKPIIAMNYFSVAIPISQLTERIAFHLQLSHETIIAKIIPTTWSHLTIKTRHSYITLPPYILSFDQNSSYCINTEQITRNRWLKKWLIWLKESLSEIHSLRHQLGFLRTVFLYYPCLAYKKLLGKKIWVFYDRRELAGDNAEALWHYVNKQKLTQVKSFFVLNYDSPHCQRVKKSGTVLSPSSLSAKLVLLLADKCISSQIVYDDLLSPIWWMFARLYKYQQVYLQHGIIQCDISDWLNQARQNFSIFVLSSPKEIAMVTNNSHYGLNNSQIKLLGMTRYDLLDNQPENLLLITPTWRGALADSSPSSFIASDYYQFYQKLINDKQLLQALREKKWKAEFVLHPALINKRHLFTSGDPSLIHINDNYEYRDLLSRGKLMLTDYSSISFDFAYLHKPLVYVQTDRQKFYEQHIYQPDAFDYQNDGFGPVMTTYEQTIEILRNYIVNDSKISDVYKKRSEVFFAFHDRNNCFRVYQEIQKL